MQRRLGVPGAAGPAAAAPVRVVFDRGPEDA